jgi:hypothetical protein
MLLSLLKGIVDTIGAARLSLKAQALSGALWPGWRSVLRSSKDAAKRFPYDVAQGA